MTEPTENERRQINERLARAMGWTNIRWHSVNVENPTVSAKYFEGADFAVGTDPLGHNFVVPPDFTRSAEASRGLVVWLTSPLNSEARSREDVKRWGCFTDTLWRELDLDGDDYPWLITEKLLTAPPLLIAMAADEAIGGKDEC